jgi:hypothetical protein
MELRKFISTALADIVNGVQDAQAEVGSGIVVPEVSKSIKAVKAGISEFTAIQFEVTVKSDERAGSEAKLSVVAAVIGGSVKGDSGSSSGHAATLSFSVPVRLPKSAESK